MDYKIASVTSLFFIAVVFGPLVPLLYPMGFVAILLQYYVEVITLRSFYKLSEARKQDEKMTLVNLKMLLFAPLIGLAVSIWAYSNRQMFENKIDPI
jgi:polyferredoxin